MTTSFNRIHFSSKSVKHNTPQGVFKELDEEFHFSFDPCKPPIVGNFKGDGLRDNWKGRVYCNMPYENILEWVQKGWEELCLRHCLLIVFLIPMRGAFWFKFLKRRGAEFRTCNKRIKFNNPKNKGHGAPFDSMVAILRSRDVKKYWKKLGIR